MDSFRYKHNNKKDFTKWTITSTLNPIRITATRIDHFLTSKSLQKRIIEAKIIHNNPPPSDHLPIFISIHLKLPKQNPLSKQKNNPIPHYSNWPESLAKNIETSLKKIEDYPIINQKDIDDNTLRLTNCINLHWKEYLLSLQKPELSSQNHNKNNKPLKSIRKTLLKTKHLIQNHIYKNNPLPPRQYFSTLDFNINKHTQ